MRERFHSEVHKQGPYERRRFADSHQVALKREQSHALHTDCT